MSIQSGNSARASLRDVAQRAGVSLSTVSRVLGGRPDVSPVTRERIHATIEELGYRPNAVGQMLRRGVTETVGFSVADITNPVLANITLGVSRALAGAGYSLLLSHSGVTAQQQQMALGDLLSRSVDGLIVSVIDDQDRATLDLLRDHSGPVVALDRDLADVPHADVVGSDHRSGMIAAVDALYAAGHRRVALLNGLHRARPGRERSRAFANRGEELGLVASEYHFDSYDNEGRVFAEVRRILQSNERPTALICGNNVLLPSVLEALRDVDASVPDDISLVTCDEVPLQRSLHPPLATIKRDPVEIGRVAAELLLGRLRKRDGYPAQQRILDVAFTPGASIAAPSSRPL